MRSGFRQLLNEVEDQENPLNRDHGVHPEKSQMQRPSAKRQSRFSPKRNGPRNADSRKDEKMPSTASGNPMTPPVLRENSDQFVPNCNSVGMPVTMPSRKLTATILAQN